jgi:hypothetical protein
MHPNHDAFFQFCEVTRSLAKLSEAEQVRLLKFELLHALERASHCQSRSRALEIELSRSKKQTAIRTQAQHAHSTELCQRLMVATRELATTKTGSQQQLQAMRLEILSMENQCQTLDELCRALLLTIEQAACPELAVTAPTEPAGEPRVSA